MITYYDNTICCCIRGVSCIDIDTVEIPITDITPRGGVGRTEGKTVFVSGLIPGDNARVRIIADKGRYLVGEALEIQTPSQYRLVSPCVYFPVCGGCDVLEAQPEALRDWKLKALQETLSRMAGISPDMVAGIATDGRDSHTRNKVTCHIEFAETRAAWGFRRQGSRDFVAIGQCIMEEEGCSRGRDVVFSRISIESLLALGCRKVMSRAGTGGKAQVALYLPRAAWSTLKQQWGDYSPEELSGVWFATPEGKRWELAWGEPHLAIDVLGTSYEMRAGTFFQVNSGVAGLLLQEALGHLPGGEVLLDLYCGLGFFALPLAERYGRVVGIESDQEAVADGKRMAKNLSMSKLELLPGAVEERLAFLGLKNIDAAIVDPPRAGMVPQALQKLLGLQPRILVYVSCHPATLARDALAIKLAGYRLEKVQAFDMFPGTLHLESLAVFVK